MNRNKPITLKHVLKKSASYKPCNKKLQSFSISYSWVNNFQWHMWILYAFTYLTQSNMLNLLFLKFLHLGIIFWYPTMVDEDFASITSSHSLLLAPAQLYMHASGCAWHTPPPAPYYLPNISVLILYLHYFNDVLFFNYVFFNYIILTMYLSMY